MKSFVALTLLTAITTSSAAVAQMLPSGEQTSRSDDFAISADELAEQISELPEGGENIGEFENIHGLFLDTEGFSDGMTQCRRECFESDAEEQVAVAEPDGEQCFVICGSDSQAME